MFLPSPDHRIVFDERCDECYRKREQEITMVIIGLRKQIVLVQYQCTCCHRPAKHLFTVKEWLEFIEIEDVREN